MNKSFNEVLKERELKEEKTEKDMSLDSTERIKVLSPGQMVFKRFVTNKLAIVGTLVLFIMFTFAFIVPIFYAYGQTEIFYKYDYSVVDYAQATERTEYSVLYEPGANEVHYSVKNKLTATINSMVASGLTESEVADSEGNAYSISKEADNIYSLSISDKKEICTVSGSVKYATYNAVLNDLKYNAGAEAIDGLAEAVSKAVADGKNDFTLNGEKFSLKKDRKSYTVSKESSGAQYTGKSLGEEFETAFAAIDNGNFEFKGARYSVVTADNIKTVYKLEGENRIALLTTYVFDSYDVNNNFSDSFKFAAIEAAITGKSFEADGVKYSIKEDDDEILLYQNNNDVPYAALSTMVIRRYNGEDSLELPFKAAARGAIDTMNDSGSRTGYFIWAIPQVDSEGNYTYDAEGNINKEVQTVSITNKNGSYGMTVEQVVYLIDTFAKPSKEHIAGTDGDGMDVFARMMYGGRVSLLVAFVVVILETILGVIMGGVAGFFGGWIDNLIMRMVDIFYCIPSMPILIILGALFDAMKMKPYTRVMWLMAVLGVLGWAGVARLVRGQILSLREQEFMVAAEAIGLKTKRRIFKHLVPNVMPQLIVTATSGLGSVILTESTLSFLGLGVKHPLATWGTMINSVSTAEAMKAYTYIWVPVGLLICLTVVAFNFVGDGLRDAFDPKMKR